MLNGTTPDDARAGRRAAGALRWFALALLLPCLAAALAGCLYPKERLAQNRPPKEAVRNVQAAVDQYQAERGLLPIKNADAATPKYEKFVIDFARLQRAGYIGDIPGAAFENGGHYYFLLLNEETDPVVKLMDLAVYQRVDDVQKRVDDYAARHGGSLPAGDEAYPSFRYVDFGLLGMRDPSIRSVYGGQPLQLLVHESGTVYADYGIDIRQAAERLGEAPADGVDLRELLVGQSDFVPVKSPAYYWIEGDPSASLPD